MTTNDRPQTQTDDQGFTTGFVDSTPLSPLLEEALADVSANSGDFGRMKPADRGEYVRTFCRAMGLNPMSAPVSFLTLKGKTVPYVNRGATDQLAAIHRLTREIIKGPEVIDLAGMKLVIAVARATHPNGRSETSTATVQLSDPENVLMKCETKAKRRVTLAILGLGLLDESELDTIPAADRAPASASSLPASVARAESPAWVAFRAAIADAVSVQHCRELYVALPDALRSEGFDPREYVDAPRGAGVLTRERVRALGVVLSTPEATALLVSTTEHLAQALDVVRCVAVNDPAAAAVAWKGRDAAMSKDDATIMYHALARRCVGSGEPEAQATKKGKAALAAAVGTNGKPAVPATPAPVPASEPAPAAREPGDDDGPIDPDPATETC